MESTSALRTRKGAFGVAMPQFFCKDIGTKASAEEQDELSPLVTSANDVASPLGGNAKLCNPLKSASPGLGRSTATFGALFCVLFMCFGIFIDTFVGCGGKYGCWLYQQH